MDNFVRLVNVAMQSDFKPEAVMPINSVWQMTNYTSISVTDSFGPYNISSGRFIFKFKRNSIYYLWNLFLPGVLLSILELTSFMLPAESAERPTFAVTIMLSMFVLQGLVISLLPKTNKLIVSSLYVNVMMAFATLVTVYTSVMCFSIKYHPEWAEKMVDFCCKRVKRYLFWDSVATFLAFAIVIALHFLCIVALLI